MTLRLGLGLFFAGVAAWLIITELAYAYHEKSAQAEWDKDPYGLCDLDHIETIVEL